MQTDDVFSAVLEHDSETGDVIIPLPDAIIAKHKLYAGQPIEMLFENDGIKIQPK